MEAGGYFINYLKNMSNVDLNKYIFFDNGDVRCIYTGRDISKRQGRYLSYSLRCTDGKYRQFNIHRLVYIIFKGAIPKNYVIDHIDGDKHNNYIGNLRAVPQYLNVRNSIGKGTFNVKALGADKVKLICEALIKNSDRKVVENMFDVKRQTLNDIIYHRSWKDISTQYNFDHHHKKARRK